MGNQNFWVSHLGEMLTLELVFLTRSLGQSSFHHQVVLVGRCHPCYGDSLEHCCCTNIIHKDRWSHKIASHLQVHNESFNKAKQDNCYFVAFRSKQTITGHTRSCQTFTWLLSRWSASSLTWTIISLSVTASLKICNLCFPQHPLLWDECCDRRWCGAGSHYPPEAGHEEDGAEHIRHPQPRTQRKPHCKPRTGGDPR